jgi:hypothetical protein
MTPETIVIETLKAWKEGSAERLASTLADDATVTCPYFDTPDETITGKAAIVAAFVQSRSDSPKRVLVDFLKSGGNYVALVRDEHGFVTWHFTMSDEGKVRTMVVAYSCGLDELSAPRA